MINGPHKFDKSNLRQAIYDAPDQFEVGFGLAKDIKVDGKFERAVFHGEGGSAFPVALVKILISPSVISQNHTYSLFDKSLTNCLNVFCSYSGNTEETLTTLSKAVEKGLPAIGVASGGRLEEFCRERSVPFVKLPIPNPGFQPRMGTGYFIGVILTLLSNHGLSSDLHDEVLEEVGSFKKSMADFENQGQELASKITGKTPLVWSSQKFKELALVWTIKFNEHAKNPAFWNFFPELNHNLMVGLTNLGDRYFAIMLKDPDDDPQNLKRYEITGDVLKEYGMESEVVDLEGSSVFAKLFNSIYLADFAAYYLAEKNEVDPTPVDMVEEFKARLKS